MKLLMIKLVKIEFRERPDVHTISYAKRVQEWLSQWTVANNFTPVVFAMSDEDKTTNLATEAVTLFIDKHIKTLRSGNVLSDLTQVDRDYDKDFCFSYEVYMGESGKPMVYAGCGSV